MFGSKNKKERQFAIALSIWIGMVLLSGILFTYFDLSSKGIKIKSKGSFYNFVINYTGPMYIGLAATVAILFFGFSFFNKKKKT